VAFAPSALADALRDRYTIERELGRGGMATVYLARDLKHDRLVALKVLRPELAATLGPERFQHEIRFAAWLQHPHILSVHDSAEAAGQLWFTMPYVEGESLRTRLTREGQLPIEAALRITSEAAQALQYAHKVYAYVAPEGEHQWRLDEAVPSLPAGDRRIISLAWFELIRCSKQPIRGVFLLPASPSSRVPVPRGTRIRWARP
jgi:hypothetical protein